MKNVNLLKPNKENLNLFLLLGTIFFTLGIFDFSLNNFYEKNNEPNTKNKLRFSLLAFNKFILFIILFFLYRYTFIIPVHK